LFLPHLTQAGVLPDSFTTHGPFNIALLKPYQLFGLTGIDEIAHSTFWSMLANISAYIGVSLFTRPTRMEHNQAVLFVDIFKRSAADSELLLWPGTASIPDLQSLLGRFLGRRKAENALNSYFQTATAEQTDDLMADPELVSHAEKLLAGSIGSASARIMVRTILKEETPGIDEVMNILEETRQVIAHSHELERTTAELKAANERLQELDRLKDDFISTVTHELKTPLTSVRSLTEILHDHPDLDETRRKEYLQIIVKESERLTRLITQVLNFQKIDSDGLEWHMSRLDLSQIIRDSITASQQLIQENNISLTTDIADTAPLIDGDHDRLTQVMMNLISNAVKFCSSEDGRINIALKVQNQTLQVSVKDNGIGIEKNVHQEIFEKFKQINNVGQGRSQGTGLGLAIAKKIIEYHKGRIWVESKPGHGSTFKFIIPFIRNS
jgi:signal transduction histidine kinase